MTEPNIHESQGEEQQPHVLVIDDEATALFVVSMRLKSCGFCVSTASSAAEAYEIMGRQAFEAIVTDVVMPGEDGISFMNRIHLNLPDVPVILLTGLSQIDLAVNVIKKGAFDLIHKPVDLEYLCRVTERAVKYNRLRRLEHNYQEELEATVAIRTAELNKALAELDAARLKLVKTANEKSEFMSNITHEMRTPMNGVIGALDLLEEEQLTGTQREYAQLARMAANNMMELVERLLGFASGTCKLTMENESIVDLNCIFDGIAQKYRPRFSMKGLLFEMEVAPEVPDYIRCEGEQLTRLLDILLGNALKFTETGFVRLNASTVKFDGVHEAMRISVCDSGIGIPEDMVERIFEPFIQVDGALTRRFGGTGLGLSIARQIAMLLNGSIWAESVLDKGSCFTFMMRLDSA